MDKAHVEEYETLGETGKDIMLQDRKGVGEKAEEEFGKKNGSWRE